MAEGIWRPGLDITQRYNYEQSDRSAAFAPPIGLSHVCIKIDEGPLMPKAGSARAALLLVALLAVAACGQDNRYAAPPPPKVTVAIPVEQEVSRYFEATGNAAAINTVDLVPRVRSATPTAISSKRAPLCSPSSPSPTGSRWKRQKRQSPAPRPR
jgi:hypothetical protein